MLPCFLYRCVIGSVLIRLTLMLEVYYIYLQVAINSDCALTRHEGKLL